MANAFNLTAQLNLRGPSNLKPVIKNIKSQLGNINANVNLTVAKNSSTNIAKLNAGLKALNKTLNTTTVTSRNAAKAISSLGTAINGINANQVSASINKATQASAQLASKQQSVSKSLASSRTEMEEFGKQSGLAIRRFAAFSAVTAVVFKLNNAITTGVSSFIEFEKQFIRLQQVTGDSAQSLGRLQTSITKLSTGLGVTSQELSQVSVTLAQAGLNARETEKALEALALSALAPSFDNLNNTVEGSIALMRQFGISSNDLGKALGSINAVAASFAVEAGDIIKAISRTGGVFANASKGVSEGTDALNEFIAVFTSVRATTRESAETIATGLRTIFTRIQRGSTIEALKEFGVTLTDLEGKFVGPFKAIQLLSQGLGKLDPRDISFSNIVEELGGFRQIGKVIPLIQQFATAQRALGVANAGQASLAEDAAIAQLSLANQISKVREEFLGLFREIGGSDSFQTIAKGALGLASALIKIADSVKGVLPVLAIMGAAKGLSAVTQFTAGFAGGIQRGGGARGFGSRMSGAPSGFATGGLVPGQGNRDTVPAMLTPGEFVIRKKAVETIGASRLGRMNKYGRGGKVQKFAGGGFIKQLQGGAVNVGAAVFETASPKTTEIPISLGKIRKSLGIEGTTKKPATEELNPKIFTRNFAKNISTTREGLSKDTNKKFKDALDDGLVKAVNLAGGRLSSDLGMNFTAVNKKNKQDFLQGVNDAAIGNLFEDVLTGITGKYLERKPGTNFDFPKGLGPNLKDNFPNLPDQWVDAKASKKASEPRFLEAKALNEIVGEIRNDRSAYLLPTNKKQQAAAATAAAQPVKGQSYSLNQLKANFGVKSKKDAIEKGYSIPFDGKYEMMASGGSVKDTVPALLTPGEFVINRKAAKSLGSFKLNSLNKADKLQGFNKGGAVGFGFSNGGGVPLKPDVIERSTVAIPDTARQGLEEIVSVLEELGLQSKATSGIVANQGRVSYETAIDAAKADLQKAKAAGASSTQIGILTKNLINLQTEAQDNITKRQGLEKAFTKGGANTASRQADILNQAEHLAHARIKKATATQGNNLTAEDIAGIRDQAFSDATRSVTGVSGADLKASGIQGSDIQRYISETEMDANQSKAFYARMRKLRTQQLLSQKTTAGVAKYTAAEAKKLANQEIQERRKITTQLAKSKGLPTGEGFGARLKGMGGTQASIAASLALPMITDFFAGGEPTSASGASSQALVQGGAGAISTGLAVGSIAGPIAGVAAGAISMVKAFADAKNAAIEFADKLSRSKIEESAEKINKAFEELSKNATNAAALDVVQAELSTISGETRKLAASNEQNTKIGLLNIFDILNSSEEAKQRGDILNNQGVIPFLESLMFSSKRESNFDKERPRIARENAKLFAETTQATRQFIQSLVDSGKTYEELVSDPTLLKFSENLALADLSVQKALQNITDPAQRGEFIQQAAAERAREQINISINTKSLNDLNKISKELSLSFKRLFSTMDQNISRANFNLGEFDKNLELTINSLRGSASIGNFSSRDANILENPLGYSNADFSRASGMAADRFGGDSGLVRGLLQLGPALEDSLLKTINNVLSNEGDNPEVAKGRVSRAVQEELKNLGLPASLTSKLAREIAKAVGDITNETDKGSISLQELTEKISGLNDLIGTSAQARKTAINALNQWQASLNSYASAINKMTEIQLESANRLRKATSILFDAQINLASALGQDVDLNTLERERDRDIRSRTGGTTDPVDITNSLRLLESRRERQQADRDFAGENINAPDASAAVIKTTQELAKTNFQINETRAALESLANDSNLASAALNKIQKAQQDQAGKVTFIEKLVTSTPEQLKDLNNSFADLQRYISGQSISIQQSTAAQKAYRKALRSGANPRDAQREAQKAFADQRGNALSLLKEISPFLGDNQQSNNLRASALETMLRESGVGMTPMLSDVIDAMRNPSLDPATAKAIATYQKAINVQAQANVQLARLNDELASKIAKDTSEAIKEALESVTIKFDEKQIQDMVDGIRTAGQQPDNKAAGGIIYASQGTAIDFSPKGTDTVPAMLTPGEFVINRSATQKHRPILEAINNGYSKGGGVSYYATGGHVVGSSPNADDIWKETAVTPKTKDEFDGAPTPKIYTGYKGLTVGHKIANGKVTFGDDRAKIEIGGDYNVGLDKDNRRVGSQEIPYYNSEKILSISDQGSILTGAKISFAKDSSGISTKVGERTANIGTPEVLSFPFFHWPERSEKLDRKGLKELKQAYAAIKPEYLNIKTPKKVGSYLQYTGVSGKKLKVPTNTQDLTVANPSIETEFRQGFFNDIAMVTLSNLVSRIADPDAGLGLFQQGSTGYLPSMFASALLGYSDSDKNIAEFGAGKSKKIGSSVFIGSDVDNSNVAIKTFDKYTEGLNRLKDQRKLLKDTLAMRDAAFVADTSQNDIINRLNQLYNSNSPFLSYNFPNGEFKNLGSLDANDGSINVYGGGNLAFENEFGTTLKNMFDRGQTSKDNSSYYTRKPINLSQIDAAGRIIGTKDFGWTSDINASDLDTDFNKKQQEEKDKISKIKGERLPLKKGAFDLTIPVHGKQQKVDIPYFLSYTKTDGQLWDSNLGAPSNPEKLLSDVLGGPGYVLNAIDHVSNPYKTFDAGADISLLANKQAFNSDAVVKPNFIKKQFQNTDVKKYLGKVLEQGIAAAAGSRAAAANVMSTTISGSNKGLEPLSFLKKYGQTFLDPATATNVPTNAKKTSFTEYLDYVAEELEKGQNTARSKAGSEVANTKEFTSNLSNMKYLKPAFETIANTAFSLFGAGAPYNFGAQFGVPLQNLTNKDQIKQLSSILSGQLDSYYTNINKIVTEGNFPNLNAYDLYNNAEVLSYGAGAAFGQIAESNTNAITRYLKLEDLDKPNFDWRALQQQTLTMFRAIGGGKRANRFLSGEQGQLSADDKLDLSTIIGDGDTFATPTSDGKVTDSKSPPTLENLQQVVEMAFNPYNKFDEITDRKILINAIKSRFMGATDGPNGRPLYSQQMMANTLQSMDDVKLWFGGQPGANTDISQPPEGFEEQPAGNKDKKKKDRKKIVPWKGVDYLYDRDPPTPDYNTRLTELYNFAGYGDIYKKAKKGMEELGALFKVGSLPSLDYYKSIGGPKEKPVDPVGLQTGGMIYASQGQLVNFQPQGTDTVPAMLTPGEFVINKKATQNNLPLLKAINNGVGGYSQGGVVYLEEGGQASRNAIIQRFVALDKNRNGRLEQEEFADDLFYDSDGSGSVDLAEFLDHSLGSNNSSKPGDNTLYNQEVKRANARMNEYQAVENRALRREDIKTLKEAERKRLQARSEVLKNNGSLAEANAAGLAAQQFYIENYQENVRPNVQSPNAERNAMFANMSTIEINKYKAKERKEKREAAEWEAGREAREAAAADRAKAEKAAREAELENKRKAKEAREEKRRRDTKDRRKAIEEGGTGTFKDLYVSDGQGGFRPLTEQEYRKKTIEAEGDSIQFNQGEKPFKVYDANGNQLSTGKDGDSVFRTAFRKKIEDREWEERFGDKKKEYDPTGINRVDLYDANGNKIDFSKTKVDISTSSAAQMLGGGIETYDKQGNKVDISDDYTANQAVKQQRKTKRDEKAEERSLLTPYEMLEQDTNKPPLSWDQRYINNTFPEEREYFDSMHVDKAKKDKRFRELQEEQKARKKLIDDFFNDETDNSLEMQKAFSADPAFRRVLEDELTRRIEGSQTDISDQFGVTRAEAFDNYVSGLGEENSALSRYQQLFSSFEKPEFNAFDESTYKYHTSPEFQDEALLDNPVFRKALGVGRGVDPEVLKRNKRDKENSDKAKDELEYQKLVAEAKEAETQAEYATTIGGTLERAALITAGNTIIPLFDMLRHEDNKMADSESERERLARIEELTNPKPALSPEKAARLAQLNMQGHGKLTDIPGIQDPLDGTRWLDSPDPLTYFLGAFGHEAYNSSANFTEGFRRVLNDNAIFGSTSFEEEKRQRQMHRDAIGGDPLLMSKEEIERRNAKFAKDISSFQAELASLPGYAVWAAGGAFDILSGPIYGQGLGSMDTNYRKDFFNAWQGIISQAQNGKWPDLNDPNLVLLGEGLSTMQAEAAQGNYGHDARAAAGLTDAAIGMGLPAIGSAFKAFSSVAPKMAPKAIAMARKLGMEKRLAEFIESGAAEDLTRLQKIIDEDGYPAFFKTVIGEELSAAQQKVLTQVDSALGVTPPRPPKPPIDPASDDFIPTIVSEAANPPKPQGPNALGRLEDSLATDRRLQNATKDPVSGIIIDPATGKAIDPTTGALKPNVVVPQTPSVPTPTAGTPAVYGPQQAPAGQGGFTMLGLIKNHPRKSALVGGGVFVGGGTTALIGADNIEEFLRTTDVTDQSVDPDTLPIVDPDKKARGGIVYASNGALIQAQSSGSDTVPAMLTPGEFVMNRLATSQNRPLLESMNSGQFNSGGLVRYMASGGYVQPQRLQEGGGPISGQQVQSAGSGGVNNVSMERPSWVDDVLSAFNSVGPAILEASSSIGSSAQQLASAVPSNGIDINNNVNVNGSVGLDSQSLGRAVAMGSQQGENYADKKVGDVQSKIQSDTDGGLSFYA